MAKSLDEKVEAVHRGQKAALVLGEISGRVEEKELAILNRLVSAYRGGKQPADYYQLGIAEIASLRSLLSELEQEIREGVTAKEAAYA